MDSFVEIMQDELPKLRIDDAVSQLRQTDEQYKESQKVILSSAAVIDKLCNQDGIALSQEESAQTRQYIEAIRTVSFMEQKAVYSIGFHDGLKLLSNRV